MPAVVILHDARGRAVPLARWSPTLGSLRLAPGVAPSDIDGLAGGFFKSKRLKKFWNKYRKPIVGGVLAAGAVGGALFTGGATLAAVPAVLGTVAKGAGSVLGATGGAGGLLSAAGSLIGGRGGGGGSDEASPPATATAPVATASVRDAAASQGLPVVRAGFARPAAPSGLAGIPTPVLIGGGVALLAVLMLMQQRSASPHIIEVRRP